MSLIYRLRYKSTTRKNTDGYIPISKAETVRVGCQRRVRIRERKTNPQAFLLHSGRDNLKNTEYYRRDNNDLVKADLAQYPILRDPVKLLFEYFIQI